MQDGFYAIRVIFSGGKAAGSLKVINSVQFNSIQFSPVTDSIRLRDSLLPPLYDCIG